MDTAQHARPGLTEDQALEVLAFLVTAARTQVDEAAEYGPMRLLMAAQRLATHLGPAVEGRPSPVVDLVSRVAAWAPVSTPTRDREDYVARVDDLCVAVADALVAADEQP